jgi:modulator of FtsH protease
VDAYDATRWEPYAIALLGAAAVLVGLIFVGLSINLERLLRVPWLFRRAAGAVILLGAVLVAAALVLVPGQAPSLLGIELAGIGVASIALLAGPYVRGRLEIDVRYRRVSDQAAVMGLVAVALFVVAGASLVASDGGGLYWVVPASLLSVCRAILDSWVLLVEINR